MEEARQPGVHVRRVGGRHLTDEEMIEYYASIAAEFGGRVQARYRNAICYVKNDAEIFSYDGDDIASAKFLLMSKPHERRSEGFPLDSLSVHMESGKYYYDMDNHRKKLSGADDKESGFGLFFRRVIG